MIIIYLNSAWESLLSIYHTLNIDSVSTFSCWWVGYRAWAIICKRDLLRPQAYEPLCFDAIWISTCFVFRKSIPEVGESERRAWLTWTRLPTQSSNEHFPARKRRKEFFSWIKKQIFIWLNLKFCRRVVFVGWVGGEETPRVKERYSLIKTQNLTTLTQSGAGKALFIKKYIRLGCAWNWGARKQMSTRDIGGNRSDFRKRNFRWSVLGLCLMTFHFYADRKLFRYASCLKNSSKLLLTSFANSRNFCPNAFLELSYRLRLRKKVLFHENW